MALRNMTPRGIKEGIKGIRAIPSFINHTRQARESAAQAADQFNALHARRTGLSVSEDPKRVYQKALARANARAANNK